MKYNEFFLKKENITKNEEIILKYLQENLSNSLKIGVRGVAKETYTSTSTIMRLSKKLGYSGFVELVYKLKEYQESLFLETQEIEYSSKMIFQVNSNTGIEDFLTLLKESKIMIYGEGFSQIISNYFYMKFMILGIDCKIIDPTIDVEILEKSGLKCDALIVISKSGETEKCYQMVEAFKKQGTKSISFTGNVKSRISKSVDISFTFDDQMKTDSDIYYPNPFFGYCLIGFEELVKRFFVKYNF